MRDRPEFDLTFPKKVIPLLFILRRPFCLSLDWQQDKI